jgi:hypothetical protein
MSKTNSNSLAASLGQGERQLAQTATFAHEVTKIGMDVDLHNVVFVRQVDNATPQPAQKMSREKFLDFIARQLKLARRKTPGLVAGPGRRESGDRPEGLGFQA